MKVLNRFKVASYNFSAKGPYFFSLIRYLSFIISVMLITSMISAGITNYYNKLIYGDMYDCRFTHTIEKAEDAESDSVLKAVTEISEFEQPSINSVIDVPFSSGNKTDNYINLERVTLKTEDNEFSGTDDRTFQFKGNIKKHAMLGVNCFLAGYTIFSDIEKQVFGFYNNGRDLIKAGREMSAEKEMMMSDYILSHFGITDYSTVLNHKISLYIDDVPYITDYTLTGIVDSDFYKILPDDMSYYSETYTSQVLLCCNADTISSLGGENLKTTFYPEKYSSLPVIIKSINERDLNNELEYEESAGSQYLLTYNIKRISVFIIILLVLFISIAMFMQIISVSSNSMNEEGQYYAMLRAIGIKKKELFSITLSEHMITFIIASVIACILSFIFLMVSDICFTKMLGEGIKITVSQFSGMVIKLVPAAALLYILIISFIFFFKQRKTIYEMLK